MKVQILLLVFGFVAATSAESQSGEDINEGVNAQSNKTFGFYIETL